MHNSTFCGLICSECKEREAIYKSVCFDGALCEECYLKMFEEADEQDSEE